MENEEREVNMAKSTDKRVIWMNRVISFAVYMVLAGGFFFFGYQIGQLTVPEIAAEVLDEAVVNTDTEVMAEIWYEVCVENDRLYLYRINGDERIQLASEEVSSEIFPYDDRNELGEGLVFESFEAAQASFEDFVS